MGGIVALILVLAGTSAYFGYGYYRLTTDPDERNREETQKIVKELSKIMLVPSDPVPILATVSDKEQLTDQPFFKYAQNGDKVIIFPSEMEAVLYRPSTKKIIIISALTPEALSAPVPKKAAVETKTTAITTATTTEE